jgi:hypothetical protein
VTGEGENIDEESKPMASTLDQEAINQAIREEHQQKPHPNLEGDRLRIHLALHTVVETQIRQNEPPETSRTLGRLMSEGLTRHQAIHLIGRAVSEEMVEVMNNQRPYSEEQYEARLRALSAWPADGLVS